MANIGELDSYLTNLTYPISKTDLIDSAKLHGIDAHSLQMLEQIEDKIYLNRDELVKALEPIQDYFHP